ncbi:hypothetical protein ACFT30_06650 [Microbacterium ureisolvens]|uniref:hypothetical protein n=1 Tax=Microbacterium ureisolvens TaxID=2781186 RepID=UPI003632F91F
MSDTAPMTREEWAAAYLDGKGDLIPAPDNGSLPGKRVRFTEIEAFLRSAAARQDVLGDPLAEFLTMTGGSFDQRIQLPDDMNADQSRLIPLEYTGLLPAGWSVEVGQNAPAYGRGGGAYYSVVLDANGMKRNVFELLDVGVLRVVSES